jgi:hypothetical protein
LSCQFCLRFFLSLIGVTTTETISTTESYVKEIFPGKGIKSAEIDLPESLISLTEFGILMGLLFEKVDHNGPNAVTIKFGM